ncbi:MAG TPA: SCO family protein [Kofleriaceae bacterium]
MNAALILFLVASTARLDVGLDEHVGAQVPRDLPFVDSQGHATTLGATLGTGRPTVLVMAYARCTMLCSVVLHGVADSIRGSELVPGRDYTPVVVSLDPHETPAEGARRQDALLASIGRPNQRDAWPYLVGDEASIARLANTLGFRFAWDPDTQQFAHPAVVFVLAPDGTIAEYVRGVTFDGLPAAIRRAAAGQRTTDTASDLLSCFHFDPSLHRYGRQIGLVLRLGAALVLAVLALLIAWLVYLDRRRA